MSRLGLLSLSLVVALVAASCAETGEADVNLVADLENASIEVDASGAEITTGIGASDTPTGFTPSDDGQQPEFPAERQTRAAETAAADLITAFIGHLDTERYAEAATFATGNATNFLRTLDESLACGVTMSGATLEGPIGEATLVGAGTYRLAADAVVALQGSPERRIVGFEVKQLGNSSWLISDLIVDGLDFADLRVNMESNVKADVRLTPVELCIGPTMVTASYTVENEGREPFLPVEVFYCDIEGERFPVDGDVSNITSTVIPGRTVSPEQWNFEVSLPNAVDGGAFMVWAADPDESRQEDQLVYVLRKYPVRPSPFLSDVDPTNASLAEAFDLNAPDRPCEATPAQTPAEAQP